MFAVVASFRFYGFGSFGNDNAEKVRRSGIYLRYQGDHVWKLRPLFVWRLEDVIRGR